MNRYARQTILPEIGKAGQEKLREAKVLVIGCGALGSMVAMQLAGAGVGEIGIADFDTVDITNLQRQFFFKTDEAGEYKVELLSQRMKELNPETSVNIIREMVTPGKAGNLFSCYDFIVDGTDNPESKRMTGEYSQKVGKPCCIGGVNGFSGQVMTFLPDDGRFEEFFGEATGEGFLPCSLGGVIGPTAALCASLQTAEIIKYLVGIGELLSGRLMVFDLLTNNIRTFSF